MIDTSKGRWAVYESGGRFWCAQIVGGGQRLRLRLTAGTITSNGRDHVRATFADKQEALWLTDELNNHAELYLQARARALTAFNQSVQGSVANATKDQPK